MQPNSSYKDTNRKSVRCSYKLDPRKTFTTTSNENQQSIGEIQRLNDQMILDAFQLNQYDNIESLLNQLFEHIENFEYNTNKKMYFYYLFVYNYNHACLLQKLQDFEECGRTMEKAINNFELIQGYIISREENVTFNIQYVKLLLQFCAVMSQNSSHKQAIIYSERGLHKLIEIFRVLEALCYEHSIMNNDPETRQTSTSAQSNSQPDKVNFKTIVIREAQERLIQLSNLPSTHKILSDSKEHFEKIMKNIYYWKDNEENNEKIVRRQMEISRDIRSPRNILGVQKTSTWADRFHIGSIMTLKPKTMKMNFKNDTYYLLSSQKILQLALYASVCYFTIATQTRFSEFDDNLDSLKVIEKYKKLHMDQTILKCKLLHLKAIELAGKHLPPSNNFFNHLLSSFNKNYKFVLDQIKQESEMTIRQFNTQQLPQQLQSQYGILKPVLKNQSKKGYKKQEKNHDKKKKSRTPSAKKNHK